MAVTSLVRRNPYFPFHRAFGARTANPEVHFTPRLDAVETDAEYRITAELPGLDEDDFKVVIEDGVLTLEGEKKSRFETEGDEEAEGGYRRVESRWGRFARRLRFGSEVDEDAVKASYKNGVLEVVVPKAAPETKVRTIPGTTA